MDVKRRCWASALGDCSGPLTFEHTISVAAWQHPDPAATRSMKEARRVTHVHSDPRGRRFTRTPKVANVGARILCRHHNERTSPLDVQGGLLSDGLRDLVDKYRARRYSRLNWAMTSHRCDGRLLERWFLKTLVNSARTTPSGLPVGSGDAAPDHPTDELVEMIYGHRLVCARRGLWFVKRPGDQLVSNTGFRIKFWNGDGFVAGGIIDIAGFVFVASLCDEEPPWELVRSLLRWRDLEYHRPFRALGHDRAAVQILVHWDEVAAAS